MREALGRVVVTSDWHLDASTGGFDRFDDVSAAVDEVVAFAISSKASLFVFLGDLCDPDANRSPRCVGKAIEVASRLRANGIRSRWLVGNHDVIEDGSGTSTLTPLAAAASGGDPTAVGWRVIDRPATEVIGGVEFVWLPYVPRCASYDPAMFVSAFYEFIQLERPSGDRLPLVVAGHLSIAGKHPGSETDEMGRGREMVLPVARVRELWPDALLMNGHYHDVQASPEGVVIPGSLARLTFGEEVNHPSFLTAVAARKARSKKPPAWSVAAHAVASRRLVTLDPATVSAPSFAATDAGLYEGALIRLRPSAGTLPAQTEALASAVRERGAAAVKVLPAPAGPAVVVPEPGAPPAARLRPRDVVEAMVADAVGVDREALAAFAGGVLDEEGMLPRGTRDLGGEVEEGADPHRGDDGGNE